MLVRQLFSFLFLLICFHAQAQYKIELLDSNTFTLGEGVVLSKTSFRGLSVVDDQTIWVSGSKGTFAKSLDGGRTFEFTQLKGYEKSDFRDIEAFDNKRAIMMSSGTPAYILKTVDGGQTWKEVYKNLDTAYFLDAMDFWDDKRGILVGDPIHGNFVILETKDAGETWNEWVGMLTIPSHDGETIFAASGTSLRCWGKEEFGFVTGGKTSKFHFCMITDFRGRIDNITLYEKTNSVIYGCYNSKIRNGSNSEGAFSFCVNPKSFRDIIIVGGDYQNDTSVNNNSSQDIIKNHEHQFKANNRDKDVKGYRSCVEIIKNGKIIISCGTSGADIGKENWTTISNQSFNVVRKAKKGNAVFLAGGKGKIGRLVY